MEACKEAGWKARGTKIKCKSQIKWFDQECETEKENLQSLGEKMTHNINNSELRQLLRNKKKRLKQTSRRKKRESISKGMSNIDMQNSKETWRHIRKILGKRKTHATSLNNILDSETNMETYSNERVEGAIDYPITDKEFEAAINKLKASKSPGIDNILKRGSNKNRKGSHERAGI